jgi:citrate synthase
VGWINAALVLLADHELATSTMAVRIAASSRADPYEALLAGLGTLAGPLHGGASPKAHALLEDARRHGVRAAVDDALRWDRRLPGFGHTVYRDGDPRYAVLDRLFRAVAPEDDVALVDELLDLATGHGAPFPNVDLGLAALAWSADLPRTTGMLLFTIARVVGWLAHYVEELDERPLRYRARAVYATRRHQPDPADAS